jgi:hypothetical protein
MDHEPTPEQCEKAAAQALESIRQVLDAQGLDGRFLAKKLKSELNARETKCFKAKVLKLQKGQNGEADKVVEVEEVVYSKSLVAWDVRQKARIDAHKLRGDYPAEKTELSGFNGEPITFHVVYDKGGNGTGRSSA